MSEVVENSDRAPCPVARRVRIAYSSIVVTIVSGTCKDETGTEIASMVCD